MGMFDYVTADHPAFVCSEGHDLRDQEFQTKDFDCVLGYVHVGESLSTLPGVFGSEIDLGAFESHFDTYCDCTRCPAFVQADTFNVIPCGVEFRVYHQGTRLIRIERISPPTAEWLKLEAGRPWMHGGRGPMSYADAMTRRRDRKFFPWDPVPVVTDEQAAAQRKWHEEREADRKRWEANRASKPTEGEG